mmetsp:Transcript_5210/g.12470  ORF Transcript_5210/g.12470 Transcript_5210/m.12470 type:complete len:420 (+) Transcript_5210:227-1486(+)|eukprot:CAMPEP_0113652178 /NCGR_PEP_ID=MMETSP0017_2-20120614/27851_1 /TAXON_ID=2856 /ORGANISM="Cylindrotheca closterium" /LENGTH=419 /DNA_ID=CAMNT_0000564975 /DNA_START=167 /DNA_END=1426 /DNA_ORIENTATION=- /assembly_acc=CAM_ASM_000147
MKTEEAQVNVHNFMLIKQIIEEDGKLLLVGTFIQHCYEDESTREKIKGRMNKEGDDDYEIKFEYRFNDETADEDSGFVRWRRTEEYDTDMGKLYRHTYQVKAPLEVNVELDYFPFRVVSAKLLVELSSITTEDKGTRLRPNLILHLLDKTNMFSIQKAQLIEAKGSPTDQAKDKMDKAESYDFISPFPKVSYLYDTKKRYCPKYLVTFNMVEDGMKKFVEIVAPMFLIAGMNTIHVLNPDEEVDVADYIANSATFALSVLVFLPTMVGTSRIQQLWTINNLYTMSIFIALTLSSVPDTWAGHKGYAIAGMITYWASFLFPVINSIRYLIFLRKAKRKANPNHFWQGPNKKLYKASKKDCAHEFAKVEEIVYKPDDERLQMGYTLREVHKFRVLEFASVGATQRAEKQHNKSRDGPELAA